MGVESEARNEGEIGMHYAAARAFGVNRKASCRYSSTLASAAASCASGEAGVSCLHGP